METEKNVRELMSEETEVFNCRLDELAWLIEGDCKSAAVAVIGTKFYIALKEFCINSYGYSVESQIEHICTIMNHFRLIARDEFNHEQQTASRDKFMKEIVCAQVHRVSAANIEIPEEILDEVICNEVLFNEKLPLKFKQKDMAHTVLGYGLMVYNRIRKIENSIIKAAKKQDFTQTTAEQLAAFQGFVHYNQNRENSCILFLEPILGVHPEAQLLALIIGMKISGAMGSDFKQQIYIGSSVRTCTNCVHLITAANEVMKDCGISVKIRNIRGVGIDPNWLPPSIFSSTADYTGKNGSLGSNAEILTIPEQIFKIYSRAMPLSQAPTAMLITPRTLLFSGEIINQEISTIRKAIAYRDLLQYDLEAFERRGDGSSGTAEMLRLGLYLCQIDSFNELFKEEIIQSLESQSESQKRFATIYAGLLQLLDENQRSNINLIIVLDFLKNHKFTNQEIARCFVNVEITGLDDNSMTKRTVTYKY